MCFSSSFPCYGCDAGSFHRGHPAKVRIERGHQPRLPSPGRKKRYYRTVEDGLGETMLVVAKGFVNRVLGNTAVVAYLGKHRAELAEELGRVMAGIAVDTRTTERA